MNAAWLKIEIEYNILLYTGCHSHGPCLALLVNARCDEQLLICDNLTCRNTCQEAKARVLVSQQLCKLLLKEDDSSFVCSLPVKFAGKVIGMGWDQTLEKSSATRSD